MPDEEINEQELQEEEDDDDDIMKILGLDDDEEYEELQDEVDAREAKMVKKLTGKMEQMSKKFEQDVLAERVRRFQDSASELETSLFKAIASDVRDVATLDKAIALVSERAKELTAQGEEYKKKLEEEAQKKVSEAWGVNPAAVGRANSKEADDEMIEHMLKGDVNYGELSSSLIGDSAPWSNRG